MSIKRANFTAGEVELLLTLVKENKAVLENRKTDAVTNDEKTRCWEEIATRYNQQVEEARLAKSLRQKYENLKKNLREKTRNGNKAMKTTGGGAFETQRLSSQEEAIAEIIDPTSLNGTSNMYDNDADMSTPGMYHVNDTGDMDLFDEEATMDHLMMHGEEADDVTGNVNTQQMVAGLQQATAPLHQATSPVHQATAPAQQVTPLQLGALSLPGGSQLGALISLSPGGSKEYNPKWKNYTVGQLRQVKSAALGGGYKTPVATKKPDSKITTGSTPTPRKSPVEKWADGRVAVDSVKEKAISATNELHNKCYLEMHNNCLQWETKIFEAQLQEVKDRLSMAKDKHELEMDMLKKKLNQ